VVLLVGLVLSAQSNKHTAISHPYCYFWWAHSMMNIFAVGQGEGFPDILVMIAEQNLIAGQKEGWL
jgi:hypothetical protein